jgi:hypothetical protein
MKIDILLSSLAGREDIHRVFLSGMAKYWPDCPWPLVVMTESPDSGYCARLLRYITASTADVIVFNLDDFVLARPANGALAIRAVERGIAGGASIVHLSHNQQISQVEFPPLPGWYLHRTHSEPFYGRFHPAWMAVRRDHMIEIVRSVLGMMKPGQDRGWTGAYNLELLGGDASLPYLAAGPAGDVAPLSHRNVVLQNRWGAWGLRLIKEFDLDIDVSIRGIYQADAQQDVYLSAWRKTMGK